MAQCVCPGSSWKYRIEAAGPSKTWREEERGGGEGGVGRNGRVTTDLASLIVAMTTCGSVDELAAIEGKYDTRGLARTMAQQLATVRWAVVHDAMKVLVQLADDA